MKKYLLLLFLLQSSVFADKPEITEESTGDPTPQGTSSSLSGYESLQYEIDPVIERENCGETVDLRAEFERRNLPDRRHQDTTGWCYAFVAADLVSFETSQNISASDIARQYLNRADPARLLTLEQIRQSPLAQNAPLGGGYTDIAINLTREAGFCLEDDFPSEDYSSSIHTGIQLELDETGKPIFEQSCIDRARIEPLYTQIEIAELLEMVTNNEFINILNNLAISECRQRIQLEPTNQFTKIVREKYFPYNAPPNNTLFNTIDNVIGSGRPVGVSLDPSALTGNPRQSLLSSPVLANHQILIAGRRFNNETQQCEYLIRDSQGSCETRGNYECENNHAWYPREIIRMGSVTAEYFEGSSGN